MEILYDPRKNASNLRKHGISLASAEKFDFDAATYKIDDSEDYGEVRYRAVSFLDGRLFVLTFVRHGETIRAISLRKATKHEESSYEEDQ